MKRHLKEYYANIIDSVSDGVIVLDAEENVTLMNPAAEEITGVSRRQARGNHFRGCFGGEPALLE
ncbi:MAG: PAS domain-containing protein, partial [Geobacteraceae bacterium]